MNERLSSTNVEMTPPLTRAPRPARAVAIQILPFAGFAAGHIVLCLLMRAVPVVATAHAIGAVLVALYISSRGPLYRVGYAIAYIAGCEVLWRMTHAGVFWEYGKYAGSLCLIFALARMRARRNVGLSVAYLAFLLPSAALTIIALAPDVARQQLSFNLSGPLSLALCVLFFSNVHLTANQTTTTFLALIGPVIGITVLSYVSTITTVDLAFTGQSNGATSGGFGPNQVSSMLGLGLLLSLLLLFERRQPWRLKGPLLFLAVAFATQSALTFSRGGLALAFASAFVAIFYLVRDSRTRATLVVLGALLFGVGRYVVVPRLEEFTQGKLSQRYTSTKTSNRDRLATLDLEMFTNNPGLGVGPGVGATIRSNIGVSVAAHTEFTRMLGEHGVLGALSIMFLLALQVRTARDARTIRARAFVLAMLCWFTLFLLINAMRVFAPSLIFGLACAIANSSRLRPKPATTLEPASISS